MKSFTKLEAVLWSIALPGFSQLLSGHIWKGILFVVLEITINVFSNFNRAIMYSFLGEIENAIEVTDFQWLMFYPCLYMFAMWDSYRSAMIKNEELSYLPFVFSAYFVTVGLMYSTKLTLFGVLFGPVFLPMLFLIPGLVFGFLVRWLILTIRKQRVL
ncbi:hypothetical protein RRV45_08130 [Bacillus sp. DTU_2020_1000418_1_SI_GHA_SEK_038]|uniref:hypothetical protein n=1 Tax=Bacillus sp. DTU_2020_1000418_1_SI_GHA_SEK_038 TaxID=3077585 RepID=UPI0028E39D2B|nr:hypothetical protein [Bacillus sp. DTU_2020_1000418_1_SI_GHA_SEK_038]WNS76937.1 hypothetical protein RRV45_08130 [Bacillus sp. DTU_2020_1000418_1_SI_GHA_SEK_038]